MQFKFYFIDHQWWKDSASEQNSILVSIVPNHSNQPWAWVNMIVPEPVVNISRNSILFPMGQTGIIKVGVIKLNQAIKRRTWDFYHNFCHLLLQQIARIDKMLSTYNILPIAP